MGISTGFGMADRAQQRKGGEREDRVAAAFTQARRHSGRVRLLKIVLPVAAVAMMVVFAGKSWLSAPGNLDFDAGALAIEGGRLVMTDPRLDGAAGSSGRSYVMTASRAIQDIGMSGRVDLEGIDAKFPVSDKGWMNVTAPSGVFDRDANRLNFDSEMTITDDDGMKAVLQSAVVDVTAGNLDTSDPVDITLDGAHITADSMSVRDKGAVLIFENRVRMQIEGGRLGGVAAEGESE